MTQDPPRSAERIPAIPNSMVFKLGSDVTQDIHSDKKSKLGIGSAYL